jgi:hypothetical protein
VKVGLGTEVEVADSITDDTDEEASSTLSAASARTVAAAKRAAAPATKRIVAVVGLLSHRAKSYGGEKGRTHDVEAVVQEKEDGEDNVDEAIDGWQI